MTRAPGLVILWQHIATYADGYVWLTATLEPLHVAVLFFATLYVVVRS